MASVSGSSCSFDQQYTCCNIHHLCCVDMMYEGDRSRSPLYLACVRGHSGVVQYLVENANCDVSK